MGCEMLDGVESLETSVEGFCASEKIQSFFENKKDVARAGKGMAPLEMQIPELVHQSCLWPAGRGGRYETEKDPGLNEELLETSDWMTIQAASSTASLPPSTAGEARSWGSNISSPDRSCYNCTTRITPFWRRATDGNLYCNACGLYFRTHKTMRPISLQAIRNSKVIRERDDVCANCGIKKTPLWRRIGTGEIVCNACGLFYKIHKSHRPLERNRSLSVPRRRSLSIGKRNRSILPTCVTDDSWHQYYPPANEESAEDFQVLQYGQDDGEVEGDGECQGENNQVGKGEGQARRHQGTSHVDVSRPDFILAFGKTLPTYHSNMDYVHSSSICVPAIFTTSSDFPFNNNSNSSSGYSYNYNFITRAGDETAVDGSLDDSMRWFSSTCLETTFDPNE